MQPKAYINFIYDIAVPYKVGLEVPWKLGKLKLKKLKSNKLHNTLIV